MTALGSNLPDLDGDLQGALRTLQNRDFLLTQKYQEQQWRAVRQPADIRIVEFERAFVRRCKNLGVPVFAHCMVRTNKQQKLEFDEGNSDIEKDGPHVLGRAVDIIHSLRAWKLTEHEWLMLGHIGKEVAKSVKWTERHPKGHLIEHSGIRIEWGGDWRRKPSNLIGWDPAHWELEG